MDYIAVYEGDDSDDGSVKLSPGKIQRTGVKSEPAARRAIRSAVRAPGTISSTSAASPSIAMRSESFVEQVADVTTGQHVAQGPAADGRSTARRYRPRPPNTSRRITSKTTGGDAVYGAGSRQRLVNLDVPDAAIAAIEKSRTVPTSIDWTSPRDGIVLERNADRGHAGRSPAACCSGSPTTRWCGP